MDSDISRLRPVPSEPDPMLERYPELGQFFGCYFHQDWHIEAKDDRGSFASS
jgi:CdiI immunity protein